jgi:hypothetical protein
MSDRKGDKKSKQSPECTVDQNNRTDRDGVIETLEKALRRAAPVVLDRACGGRMITSKEDAESIHEEILSALSSLK